MPVWREIIVEKFSPGVYHINKETFHTQIIVTSELSPEEYFYLHCLTNRLRDTNANQRKKGATPMVCEGILNLCGTSSEEIIERTRKEDAAYYLPQIDYLKSLLEQHNIPFHLESAGDRR